MRKFIYPVLATMLMALPAAAQTLDRIKETKFLNLGYRTDAAPLSYELASGEPAGYSPLVCVQIGQAIANHLKMTDLQAQFVPVTAENRFDMVAEGKIDLLCGASTITLTRREKVDFSTPTFVDGTALVVPIGASDDFMALANKKLGVRDSTTTQEALVNSLREAGMQAEVVTFDTHNAGMAAMENKEIDAYFADQSILAGLYLKSAKVNELKISSEILTIEKHGLAMARGDSEFRLLVDSTISKMYATGKIQQIFRDVVPGVEPGLALQAMYLLAPTLD